MKNAEKRAAKARKKDCDRAVCEIDAIRGSLDEAYSHFNDATDTDALDACIYEISALRSRYNTALKHYRRKFI